MSESSICRTSVKGESAALIFGKDGLTTLLDFLNAINPHSPLYRPDAIKDLDALKRAVISARHEISAHKGA